jgi:hypothetical protein
MHYKYLGAPLLCSQEVIQQKMRHVYLCAEDRSFFPLHEEKLQRSVFAKRLSHALIKPLKAQCLRNSSGQNRSVGT